MPMEMFWKKNMTSVRTVKQALKKIIYFGTRYQCPFCHSHLRKLKSAGFDIPVLKELQVVGGGLRESVMCPVCGSRDRERLIFLYLKQHNIINKKLTMLHVAPEVNIKYFVEALEHIDYISADISGENVSIKMDITDIQFPDNYFDVIICSHVLEHIIDDSKAMSELYRTLKPGGLAILQVPFSLALKDTYEDELMTSEEERERVFGQGDHVRIYAKGDYIYRLIKTGFDIEEFEWWNKNSLYSKYSLLPQETLFLATKPFYNTANHSLPSP